MGRGVLVRGNMHDQDLTELLRLRREKTPPVLPGSFQQDVLREIRRRAAAQGAGGPGWLNWLLEPFRQPLYAGASLAFAIILGAAFGGYAMADESRLASRALDLQVFTSRSSALPSTLLQAKP